MVVGAEKEGLWQSQEGIWALHCKARAGVALPPSQAAAAASYCCKSSKLPLSPIFCPNKPHLSHAAAQSSSAFKNIKGAQV